MKRRLKWAGFAAGGLLGVIAVALAGLYFLGTAKINKTFDVQVAGVTIPTGEAAIERGRHFVQAIALCERCHTPSMGGEVTDDDPLFGMFAPSNLTSGRGGIGGTFTDIDYVRAIRHGVGRDGKSLLIMPSERFNKISDADLGAVIAYLKSLPAVDNELPDSSLRFVGRIIASMDSGFLPANLIDHEAPRPVEPEPGVTREYGQYLAFTCALCHGENLSGGSVPGSESNARNAPTVPNITPGGAPGSWSQEQFVRAIRTGVTPSGKVLDGQFMPWPYFARMTDDELQAIWLYLESLPAREFKE